MTESGADWFKQGVALHQQGDLVAARQCYDRVLAVQAQHFGALHLSGVVALEHHEAPLALSLIEKALAVEPDAGVAWFNLGRAQKMLQQLDAAAHSFERAVGLLPDHLPALLNLAHLLIELQRPTDALPHLDRVLVLNPGHALAFRLRGDALMALGRCADALESYDAALKLQPEQTKTWTNRGSALMALQRHAEALACFDSALNLDAGFSAALVNRGLALRALQRPDDELENYDRLIALEPNEAKWLVEQGQLLNTLQRFEAAFDHFDQALRLKPTDAFIWMLRGGACYVLQRWDEALTSVAMAEKWQPGIQGAAETVFYCKTQICDWNGLEQRLAEIKIAIDQGTAKNIAPMALMSQVDDPQFLLQTARLYLRPMGDQTQVLGPIGPRPRSKKIRVAYISADFKEHPVGYLLPGFLEASDRERFELTAISVAADEDTHLRRRLVAAFDRFVDASSGKTAIDVARLCRELGVDIAVDLMGHTLGAYTASMAMRCAPVQINWLGYPGTMGASFIDYIVADPTLIGAEDFQYYTEQVIVLPDVIFHHDDKREVSERVFSKAQCGLPDHGFVFCCFNKAAKFNQQTFDIWMRVLKRVPDSVLWLSDSLTLTKDNLRSEAQAQGVDARRLVFAPVVPMSEHLARHKLADLSLDTWPYNLHSTAFEALRCGVPMVSRMGRSFASRVSSSLLKASGLPELITDNPHDYEELVVALALQPERLTAVRQRLAANRLTHPLFDGQRFTRNLEAAYVQAMERHWSGLPPSHIIVSG